MGAFCRWYEKDMENLTEHDSKNCDEMEEWHEQKQERMAKIMNKVILMCRLTRAPNVRYTQASNLQESMCMVCYTLAIDRRGARDGQQSADFISCVAFGRDGEFAEKYLQQGMKMERGTI